MRELHHQPVESAATRNAERKAPDELRVALKAQLVKLLDGDLNPRMLIELEQTAALAHKMLLVAGDPRAMRGARNRFPGLVGVGGLDDMVVAEDLDAGSFQGGPIAPAPFGAGENFGAEAIRNMMAAANAPKLGDLMRALETATKLAAQAEPGSDAQKKYDAWVASLQAEVDEKLADGDEPGGDLVKLPAGMSPAGLIGGVP